MKPKAAYAITDWQGRRIPRALYHDHDSARRALEHRHGPGHRVVRTSDNKVVRYLPPARRGAFDAMIDCEVDNGDMSDDTVEHLHRWSRGRAA